MKKGHWVSSVLVPLLKNFQSELETRLPEKGINYKYYNYGNFFNPSKRGVGVKLITKDTDKFLEMTNFLVENHPTTLEFYAAREAEMTVENSETLDKAEVDELFDIIQEQELLKTSQSKLKCPPLKTETFKYLDLPAQSYNVNSLQWWKEHEKELPLLSAVTRDHLCIPVTSSSSERMFSTGGNIISAKRECIKPETLKILVFIKENYS